jgi:ABC-2 type transport system permease protein
MTSTELQALGARRFGRVNWLGVWTLYKKEVQRFLKVITQTVLAPVVTTLMFLIIFTVALGGSRRTLGDVPFEAFLAPGLIMMAIIQNAFMNTSSSLLVSKIQGNVVDFLMPPLSPGELTFCFVLGGATRGLVVAFATGLAMLPFATLEIQHLWAVLFYAVAASTLLSLLGVTAGVWAEKFDHMAVVTNFVITPLAFLSGTFYSIDRLPGLWREFAQWNPFFFLIDGFRYGFLGIHGGPIGVGMAFIIGLIVIFSIICHQIFKRGYKLKA